MEWHLTWTIKSILQIICYSDVEREGNVIKIQAAMLSGFMNNDENILQKVETLKRIIYNRFWGNQVN